MKHLYKRPVGILILSTLLLGACSQDESNGTNVETLRSGENGQIVDTGSAEDANNPETQDAESTDDVLDVIEEPDQDPDPAPCLQEDQCFDTFPIQIVDSTIGGSDVWDSYGCEYQTNESGPERVYKVVLNEPGFLATEITAEGADVDVDVHILSENDNAACVDRGHFSAAGLLDAGTYWVVVDSWADEFDVAYPGDFELSINVVRPSDLAELGIYSEVAVDAMTAFSKAWKNRDTKRLEYSVIDFSLHSSIKRQWVLHLSTGELLYNLHVAHGRASVDGEDQGYSTLFSNIPESHQSSLGMIKTAEPYTGDYGYSLRLDGLEPGFNDLVRPRFIVVHPWDGSAPSMVASQGLVTPTWGCAALDPAITTEVVNRLSGGSLMFFWSPEGNWRAQSTYL